MLTRKVLLSSAFAWFLCLAAASVAYASNYYISSTGCSDSNSGTSSAAPWCSLTKVNGLALSPGDRVLLNRGSTWTGQHMTFTNSGTSASPLTLADYGSASNPRPRIIGNNSDAERMVTFVNPSYWDVRNLEVSNAGVGVYVLFSTLMHEGLNFNNIYVHDIRGVWAGHTTAYPGPLDDNHPFDPNAQRDSVFMSSGILFTAAQVPVANGGFESPVTSTYMYGPFTNEWAFSGNSGVQHNGSVWGAPNAPQGVQTLFLQGPGNISQTVNFQTDGFYSIKFQAAKRTTSGGTQSFDVYFDHTAVGSFTPSSGSFSQFMTNGFHATAGHHTIQFVGTTTGDNTDFIDAVQISIAFDDTQYAARNLNFTNIEGAHNVDSLSIDPWNGMDSSTPGSNGSTLFQNIVMKNLYLHDDDGHAAAAYQNATMGCSDSLRLSSVTNVKVIDSILNNEAACHIYSGTAAVILQRVEDVIFANNIMTNVPNTNSPDGGAIDQEFSTENVTVRNNYIAGNAGPGLEILNIHGGDPDDRSLNTVFSGNLFSQNGKANAYGSVYWLNGGTTPVTPTGTFSNNLYYEPGQPFLTSSGPGNPFVQTNNVRLDQPGYHAANDFAGTQGENQWKYQYKNAGVWTDLTYDANNRWWYQNSTYPWLQRVEKFEMHPGNCSACDVARVWVAPASGTVSIRGRVFKWDTGGGDGITARINKVSGASTTQLWPASGAYAIGATDQVGVDTDLDNIAVSAGDMIRFEIGSGPNGDESYDETSWVPIVAYRSFTNSSLAYDWGFNADGNTEGWTNGNQISQSVLGGINTLTSNGTDPYIYSDPNLNLNASAYKYVKIRMKNNTGSNEAQVFFITAADTTWTAAKSVLKTITTNDGDYSEYVFDFSANSAWAGTIKQLRFDPIAASGTVNVDYIRVSNSAATAVPLAVAGFELTGTGTYTYGPFTYD
ncbi:hypothetical protein [Cohnella nanjingensis]|uniref:Right handed beta helix domain-containing protein n=1 Tax=Cohnella nanjingensis TaxID=1387779 RepID=A0A7X0VFX1_9BACL|nr:hypothetical protein [Cohnella nanjingensis]MBB6672251.1 hypothetical protein [Cohnella nanjingensis]